MAVGGKGENIKVVIDLELTDESLKKADKTGGVEIGELGDKTTPDIADSILDKASVSAVEDKLGSVSAGVGSMGNFVKNPAGFMARIMGSSLPLFGAVFALMLAIPEIIEALGKLLFGAGGPFDRRFKREIKREFMTFLTREEQKRRALGLDQLIWTWNEGFSNSLGRQTVYSAMWTAQAQPVPTYLNTQSAAHVVANTPIPANQNLTHGRSTWDR
jgi:hypothetical protein|tara:strand:- start:762 stop:1409 length:648 start_codon:yes stop_codon:yes gene_type:complete